MTESTQAQNSSHTGLEGLDVRFAFDGAVGRVLEEFLRSDADNWKLSWKFRKYYQLRKWIPLRLRQWLQQVRNTQLPVDDQWYYQHDFLVRLRQSLIEESQQQAANAPAETAASTARQVIHPWPDGFRQAAVLTHDIETQQGLVNVDRLARLEESYGLRSAWYFVPASYTIDLGLLDDLQSRGHEVGVHGYNHDGQLFMSSKIFQHRAAKINDIARAWQARGFRSPMMHRHLGWMQSLEFDHDASCFDIDPFQAMPGGVAGVWPFIVGNLVELPCTLPQDHTLFVTLQQQTTEVWKRKLELIGRLHGMAVCLVHPDYLDSPLRWELYQELLEQFASADDAWKSLPSAVARWWRQRDQSSIVDSAIVGPAAQRGRTIELQQLFADL